MTSEKLPISAFIICQDEEDYLANCIRSLVQCKEIIIVDSGSTDKTFELIREFQAQGWPIRLLHQKWLGYTAQLQFAMDQCVEPWLLNIHSDERFDEDFRSILPELLKAPESVVAWRIPWRPYLVGLGYTPKYVCQKSFPRLVRRGKGAYDMTQPVHAGIVPAGKAKETPRGSILHFRPLPIEEQMLRENKYSTLKAQQVLDTGQKPRLMRLIFNPVGYFFRNYFYHRLIFCGFPGFIHAATSSVYSFLTEAKIYQRHAQARRPSVDDLDGEKW